MAITLLCLSLAFYRVDLAELSGALLTANYVLVAPAAVCTLAGYLARSARWQIILPPGAAARPFALFGVLMIGFAANNLLPARLGEFARAYLLGRRTGAPTSAILASVFLERLFDGLALVAVMASLSLFVELPGWGREVQIVAGGLFVGAALAVGLLLARADLVERLLGPIVAPLPGPVAGWVAGAFGSFLVGLTAVRSPGVLLRTGGFSLVVWGLEWTSYYILSSALPTGLPDAQRAAACAFLLVVVNLGIMLPSSPGYVGTFQFFAVAAMTTFGVAREVALAFAIVAHVSQYVLVTSVGALFFASEQVSLQDVAARRREQTLRPALPGRAPS